MNIALHDADNTKYPGRIIMEIQNTAKREGLSAKCTLNASVVMAILIGGREHPCDRCNEDRKICHGFPRKNDLEVIL